MTMNAIAAVAGAVLNSLWQSLVLTLLVWLALRIVRARVNAATRHAIWWTTLAVIVLLPCIPRSGRPSPAAAGVRTAPMVPPSAPRWPVSVAAPLSPPAAEGGVAIIRKRATVWPLWVLAIWMAFFVREAVVVLLSFPFARGEATGTTVGAPTSEHGPAGAASGFARDFFADRDGVSASGSRCA